MDLDDRYSFRRDLIIRSAILGIKDSIGRWLFNACLSRNVFLGVG